MKHFPTGFAAQTTQLDESIFKDADAELVRLLKEKGYEVHVGLTPAYADKIAEMSLEPSIKEYCPNDSGRRFADRAAAEKWLAKGRAAFLLFKKDGDELSLGGYGWAGVEASPHVPNGEITFALRVGEASQGQGLATPFSRLVIAAAAVIYQAQNFWLETWASNAGAVHIYHKLGFVDVDQTDDTRPTADGQTVPDTRLYMSLANGLLN